MLKSANSLKKEIFKKAHKKTR